MGDPSISHSQRRLLPVLRGDIHRSLNHAEGATHAAWEPTAPKSSGHDLRKEAVMNHIALRVQVDSQGNQARMNIERGRNCPKKS